MNYLRLALIIFLASCSSDKNLVDVEYYMKEGKEISLVKKNDFKEIKKIDKLNLSKPILITNWLSTKINSRNYLPRFLIDDFKKKNSIDINAKSFLVINNNIYIIDSNSHLFVFDENLKKLKKKTIYKKKEFNDYILNFSMTADDKTIYVSDNLGNLHGIEIETLKIKWSLKLGVPIKSSLYLNNNNLYFVNTNSKIYSIKISNGEINWSYETASKLSKEKYQISISNNLLIATNDYGEIYCLDLIKNNILWKLSLNDQRYQIELKNFKASPILISEGVLYFSSNFGETLAMEVSTGKILWRKLISSTNLPIINNNYVFLINEKGLFYICNKKNGDIIYSKDLNQFNSKKNQIIYYDMVLGKDYIYFINSSENVIKLDIHNLSLVNRVDQSFNNPNDFFVLNNHLYILEKKSLSKLY